MTAYNLVLTVENGLAFLMVTIKVENGGHGDTPRMYPFFWLKKEWIET
jgi:hypothetical protein